MNGIALIAVLATLFMFGCVGSENTKTNEIVCDVFDENSTCIPADVNRELCGIDENIPTCTSGNQWPDVGGSIPSIPGVEVPIPTTPNTPPAETETASGEVTDAACAKIQFGAGFAGLFIQTDGVDFTYNGVAGYKEKLWCSYSGSNEKGTITAYQNPFVDDTWMVVEEGGKVSSTHIQEGNIIEICDGAKCQSMMNFGLN